VLGDRALCTKIRRFQTSNCGARGFQGRKNFGHGRPHRVAHPVVPSMFSADEVLPRRRVQRSELVVGRPSPTIGPTGVSRPYEETKFGHGRLRRVARPGEQARCWLTGTPDQRTLRGSELVLLSPNSFESLYLANGTGQIRAWSTHRNLSARHSSNLWCHALNGSGIRNMGACAGLLVCKTLAVHSLLLAEGILLSERLQNQNSLSVPKTMRALTGRLLKSCPKKKDATGKKEESSFRDRELVVGRRSATIRVRLASDGSLLADKVVQTKTIQRSKVFVWQTKPAESGNLRRTSEHV
jgi:hypothetical protein